VGIVPGIIAFAVDLTTGAIYLPAGSKSRTSEIFGSVEIERRPFAGHSAGELERVLGRHIGRSVHLEAGWLQPRPDLIGSDSAAVEAELRALNATIARERIARDPIPRPSPTISSALVPEFEFKFRVAPQQEYGWELSSPPPR
jgi:hypothetical protein